MEEKPQWRDLKAWFVFRPYERHSLVLMVGGLAYVGLGASFLIGGPDADRELAIFVATMVMPATFWGFAFVFAGALAVLSSRWPSFSDSWGYAVLTGLTGAWSMVYFTGYFMGHAPSSNLGLGFAWGLTSFMWWAISGLTNTKRVLEAVDDGNSSA
ncbi:MAG: hypothetical protein LC687_01550 [Actinobacteria bacterium]|nr:hypothetical protein [Actinomycetota bacterium]